MPTMFIILFGFPPKQQSLQKHFENYVPEGFRCVKNIQASYKVPFIVV